MARNVDQEAFDQALVAVMDYFKALLAEEREKNRRLEARLAELLAADAVNATPPGAALIAAVDAAGQRRVSRPC